MFTAMWGHAPPPPVPDPPPPSLSGGSLATGPGVGAPAGGRELGQLVVPANFSSRPRPLGASSPTAPAAPCRGPSATLPSVGCQPTPSWLPWCHLMGILLQAVISVGIRGLISRDLHFPSCLPPARRPGVESGPGGCGKELGTQESAGPGVNPRCSAPPAL